MQRVSRLFKDPDVLWLFETLIRKCHGYDGVGLPLGSLTSQWLANLYLDPLDHYLTDEMGSPYYVRYMDDFLLIGPNKEWCSVALDHEHRCRGSMLVLSELYPAGIGAIMQPKMV